MKNLVEDRSVLLIYRDCLKLIPRMMPDPTSIAPVRNYSETVIRKKQRLV